MTKEIHEFYFKSNKVRFEEEHKTTQHGLQYLHLYISGKYWGFEKNNDEAVWEYLERLLEREIWIVCDFEGLELFLDNATWHMRVLNKKLSQKGGALGITNIRDPNVRQVLNISNFPFTETLEEALVNFEKKAGL